MSIKSIVQLEMENNNQIIKELFEKISRIDPDKVKRELPKQKTRGNNDEFILDLQKGFKDEELTLMLGAGISASYNVPSWDNLLQQLLLNTINKDKNVSIALSKLFTKLFNPNSLIAGRYLQKYYTKKGENNLAFEEQVRKLLYSNIDKKAQSQTINEIINFCVAPGKSPNIDSIITYNYDDIIENSLDNLNIDIDYKSIYGVGMNPEKGQIPIYHVHGYLPRKGKLSNENIITLGENVYHEQYSDVYSWNNLVQLNKFREKTCLFIGISLADPNMRRLLDIARLHLGSKEKNHYIIKRRNNLENIKIQLDKLLESNEELKNDKVRANLKLDETSDLLKEIFESFEENDTDSFGLKTIWIDDFNEIPLILQSIRK